MKFLSRLLTTALGATLLVSSAAHARTVVIGHVNLSFHEATAAVFQNVLERSGYNVAMKKGSHSVMYPLLASFSAYTWEACSFTAVAGGAMTTAGRFSPC